MIVVDKNHLTIGTNLNYGKFLETKDRQTGGRPWLSRSVTDTRPAVAAIWNAPWNLK